MSDTASITLAETMQAKAALKATIRDALIQFTELTGIKIDTVYVQPFERFNDFKPLVVKYNVEVAVKL